MSINSSLLKPKEKAVFELRSLYSSYGYVHYKVNKFEEYDLYMRNKNFLQNENILTFTDTNGKLMALKPDITLSIIKNAKENCLQQKVYYDENVYRPADSNGFREITQTGLECIGEIDMYSMCEVIMLSLKSLSLIGKTCLLDISHIGFVSGILSEMNVSDNLKNQIVSAVSQKNTAMIRKLCENNDIEESLCSILCEATMLYGGFAETLLKMKSLILNDEMKNAFDELSEIYQTLKEYEESKNIRLDFSVVNDMNYYNGIVFQGFIEKIPKSILSGGRYDNLVHKMGKKKGAVGFAVYLDLLEKIEENYNDYDVDTLLLYDENESAENVLKAVEKLKTNGTVKAQKFDKADIKYKCLCKLTNGEVQKIESNN